MSLVRFPLRSIPVVFVVPARDGPGWPTLIGASGWVFGSLAEARHEARWLASNFGLPVPELR